MKTLKNLMIGYILFVFGTVGFAMYWYYLAGHYPLTDCLRYFCAGFGIVVAIIGMIWMGLMLPCLCR